MAENGKGANCKGKTESVRVASTSRMQRWRMWLHKLIKCKSSSTSPLVVANPLSLGIGSSVDFEVMNVFVPRNTSLPTRKEKIYSTIEDNQTSMKFPVHEGERYMAKGNNLLGTFSLTGIPPAPRGVANVNVCFDIDADGIMTVSAEDKTNGLKSGITITVSNEKGRLSKEDIESMVEDVETYKCKDEKHKKMVEARDALCNSACKMRDTLKDSRVAAKLGAADKKKIEDAFVAALQWWDANKLAEIDDFKERKEQMERICDPIIAKIN